MTADTQQAVVDVMQPTADDKLCDPAAGTGGFLLLAHRCAIVVPDNVLFQGGACETVRRKLLEQCWPAATGSAISEYCPP